MQNEKSDLSTVCEMFEEVKDKLDALATAQSGLNDQDRQTLREILERVGQLSNRREFTTEQLDALKRFATGMCNALLELQDPQHQEFKAQLVRIEHSLRESQNVKQPDKITHRHTLNFEGNHGIGVVIASVAMLFVSLAVIDHQRGSIARLRDNDLKYRHIQMRGTATPADIERLRTVFDWNRNPDSIRVIRKQVEQYEQLVQQGIEKSERARLNSAEAERLKNAAETVKEKR